MGNFLSDFFSARKYNSDWVIRRRLVLYLVLFCSCIIVWALGWISSDSRSENAVNQAFNILIMVVTVYIGGKVTDDFLKTKHEIAMKKTKESTKEESTKEESITPGAN